MRLIFLGTIVSFLLAACSPSDDGPSQGKSAAITLAQSTIFPADKSLARAEDGVMLPDGRIIVADQRHGLVAINADGSFVPFGNFAAAGYTHDPDGVRAAPNGVHLSPDGSHILTADVNTGAIYRTNVASGTTRLAYQHDATVNTAIEDSTGAIWFTQSTRGTGEARMLMAVDKPMGDGALMRLARDADGNYAAKPTVLVSGLDFANGFYLDEAGGRLFLAETLGNRVLAFTLDVAKGTVADRKVLAAIPTPDNMRRDADGMLWVASPVGNRVMVIDPDDGTVRVGFDAQVAGGNEIVAEWDRRGEAGEPRLEMMGPQTSGDMPGLPTGIIMDGKGRPAYISNLGNALVKLP